MYHTTMIQLNAKYRKYKLDINAAFDNLDEYKYDYKVLEVKFKSSTKLYKLECDQLAVTLEKVDDAVDGIGGYNAVTYNQVLKLGKRIKELDTILNIASAKLSVLRAMHIDREPIQQITDDPLYAIHTNDY